MKLMLAEDEPGLSRALTAILQHSDYEVDAALDGLTALEYLLANDYDAAILDIMVPGMDGIEVLKRTRAAGKRLPIIMLTAKSEVSDKVEGLDAGANDYLTKPFAAQGAARAHSRHDARRDCDRCHDAQCGQRAPRYGGLHACGSLGRGTPSQSRVSAYGTLYAQRWHAHAHRASDARGLG